MTVTVSSRDFNQDVAAAKRLARGGPVFITDRGRPAHVLLSFEEYQKITGQGRSLLEALTPPADLDLDFDWDPPRSTIGSREADLSS